MRYSNLKAFERHLIASAPHHLCHTYVVSVGDEFERKKILALILSYVQSQESAPIRFLGTEADLPQILEAFASPALFGQEPLIVLEDADKKILSSLAKEFRKPISFGFLLIGTRFKEGSLFEQHGVILDLLDEKPWEREKRWIEQLQERAGASGKRLLPEAVGWMMEHLEPNAALLAQELEKLLCFCAEKERIERRDVEIICPKNRIKALWSFAEEIVWEQVFRCSENDLKDSFHPLLVYLRQQCVLGAKMQELQHRGVPFSEWPPHFPKLWPKILEKKAQAAHHLGAVYFQKGLDTLFHVDFLSKSTSVPLELLYDLLRICFKKN